MKSLIVKWFLDLKLDITLEEAQRKDLAVLDLRSHGLEDCPTIMSKVTPEYRGLLKVLLLQTNQITHFSRANCHCLDNLKALTLDYNRLTDLPFDFRHMRNLTILNVSHNDFSGLHFFFVICQLKTLRVLWANATGMTEIPKEIQGLHMLHTLGLRKNKIKDIPDELFSLEHLKWLTLSGNRIESIPSGIERLKQLVHLNLGRNQIMMLPPSIVGLEELQYLYLQYNFIAVDEQVASLIISIPRLRKYVISENLTGRSNTEGVVVEVITRTDDDATPSSGSRSIWHAELRVEDDDDMVDEVYIQELLLQEIENIHLEDSVNNNRPSAPDVQQDDVREVETEGHGEMDTDDLCTVYRKRSHSLGESSVEPIPSGCSHSDNEDLSRERNAINPQQPNHPIMNVISGNDQDSPRENRLNEAPEDGCKVKRSAPDASSRRRRTEEWVIQHHSEVKTSEGESLQMTSAGLESGSNNTRSDLLPPNPPNSAYLVSQSTLEKIDAQVDLFIEAAVERMNQANSSASSFHPPPTNCDVFFVPHGKEPELIKIPSITTSFQCRGSGIQKPDFVTANDLPPGHENESNAMGLVGPPLEPSILTCGEAQNNATVITTISDLYHVQSEMETCGCEAETQPEVTNTASTLLMSLSLSSRLFVDNDSIYDPTDWEHSTPSSAIDDQDVADRLSDFHSAAEDAETGDHYPPLTDTDWFRLLPLFFIR